VPQLKELVFWLLFVIGGAFFVLFTLKANKADKATENTMWGKGNILHTLPLVYKGELLWIVCWILGILVYPSRISYIIGFLPLLMPLITLGSILLIKINNGSGSNRGLKGQVKQHITIWSRQLPCEIKLESVDYSLHRNRQIINGRIIIHLYSKASNEEVDWNYFGHLLEKSIKQPLIIQIKLNDRVIYPLL
jgi:hypothetical protein